MTMNDAVLGQGLEYVSQNSHAYTVKNEAGKEIIVAKAGSGHPEEARLHHDFHKKWLWFALLGLPLGGVLTVILSPLIIWKNLELLRNESLNNTEQVYAKNFIITSVILFILGLIFVGLFIMHLLY